MNSAQPFTTSESTADSTPRFDAVVIGAGQAGLAIGYFLARQRRRFVILEAADSIGAAWRTRWDSLVLFTSRRYDALPGLGFPGDPDGYPTRDEVIAYLEQYAQTFRLPVELNSRVRSLRRVQEGFVVELDDGILEAAQVVVATGPFQVPAVPALATRVAPEVFQTHSTGYMRPSDVPQRTVLVVGGGNTGYQIAKELSATHEVRVAVGSRQKPLPQRILGRDLFWWLTKTGLIAKDADSRIGQRLRGKDTLIGSSPRELKRRYKIELKPRVVGASGSTVSFADASKLDVDAVIWATGYRSDYSWIDAPVLAADGHVRHRRGVTDVPGLYFLGLSWQHTRGSALLGWVKDDAEFISREIDKVKHEATGTTFEPAASPPRCRKEHEEMETHDHHHDDHEHHGPHGTTAAAFPTDITGLPESAPSQTTDLTDGDETELRIAPVTKRIGDATVRMLAYNGSVPGPTLRVRQGSEAVVKVVNEGDLEATVHWHGLRLDNRYDGTHETQAPIPVGGSFTYRIEFPDPGAYWYHPHIREDYGQELGLYGNILVVPADADYWPPVHREITLTLDDVLIEDGEIATFGDETTYSAMGRFGNVMLIGGETDLALRARPGEIVRLYLTNTANTRVFNVALPGARMKLVGGDSGRVEHEEMVESVIIAPSERVVVDVLLETTGRVALEHRTPERTYTLATIDVTGEHATPELADGFSTLRHNPEWTEERERLHPYFDATPEKTLAFVAEMDLGEPDGAVVYGCPMHPEVVSDQPGSCPKCGMKLLATAVTEYVCPMHPEVVSSNGDDRCPKCGMKLLPAALVESAAEHGHGADHAHGPEHGHGGHHGRGDESAHGHDHGHGSEQHAHEHAHHGHHHHGAADGATRGIEWEDDMVDVNRITTPANTRWKFVDKATGAANHDIDWRFRVGDRVKLRLVNEMDSDHPMHHPFHVHGAGRFVILSRDGVREQNLVWKDTVLVRTGETVEILLDVTNPGIWMAHCHIAEHHESGMMFSFNVDPA
jgi:FtsP/CotA-like multicopper oxidase with cupredoxin domain